MTLTTSISIYDYFLYVWIFYPFLTFSPPLKYFSWAIWTFGWTIFFYTLDFWELNCNNCHNHKLSVFFVFTKLIITKAYDFSIPTSFGTVTTSAVYDAQQMTLNFANNRLSGSGNFNEVYKTGKTRVAVTVGMMTTGYDCPDILNLCLMRPIFSPTDFIQIKGRGTRRHNFNDHISDPKVKEKIGENQKTVFKIFDFFANCEYFEEKFDYDEVLRVPRLATGSKDGGGVIITLDEFESARFDKIASVEESEIGPDGMRIDRMYFQKFEETVKRDPAVIEKINAGHWEAAADYIQKNHFDKPKEFYNLEKLRKAVQCDRRISLREMVEYLFGMLPYFKSKNEYLDDAFDAFDSRYLPSEEVWKAAKNVFKSYALDASFREAVDSGRFTDLFMNPNGEDFRKISPQLRKTNSRIY